jgi:anti-sigma factor RsiW
VTSPILSQDQVLEIMAWVDGELDGEDAARVEAFVASNDEAKELVRSFDALGDFVRSSSHQTTVDSLEGLVDSVMEKTKPSGLERARLKRAQKGRVVLMAATLTALAAGVLVYARTQPVELPSSHLQPSATPAAAVAMVEGVQVEQLDTQDNGVSVFYVPADDTKSPNTTVVWIDDGASANESP